MRGSTSATARASSGASHPRSAWPAIGPNWRALENLLANAARYGRDPATGTLELSVELRIDGRQAVIAIADRGPGIAPDAVERLVRPFERGEAARSGHAGAGLGLAIVDRVARLHGGTLALEPNPPRGLSAQLRLPLG